MAAINSQDTRLGRLHTPLGEDKLVLLELSGTESVNELFEFRITALSEENDLIDLDDLLGQHCSVDIKTLDGGVRWFDGIITAGQHIGSDQGGSTDHRDIRPRQYFIQVQTELVDDAQFLPLLQGPLPIAVADKVLAEAAGAQRAGQGAADQAQAENRYRIPPIGHAQSTARG